MNRRTWHITLTRLVPALPGGRWISGTGICATLLLGFWVAGVFGADYLEQPGASYSAALFFSVIIAYIVPMFHFICERTHAALDQLRGVLDIDADQLAACQQRIYRKPIVWFVVVLALGNLAWILQSLMLFGSPAEFFHQVSESAAVAAVVLGTVLVWNVMTLVLGALIDSARLFGHVARYARVELLDPARLRPFANIAVLSTLSIIGAQAAFPIMLLQSELDSAAFVPGFIATSVPLVLLAVLPVWPVHARIAAAKQALLETLNQRIAELPAPDPRRPESLARLAPLLTYRREILQAPEWPFDMGNLTRLGLYLIIPPLTWIGAALIEHLVDSLF
ncbi:MAG: hypothetical protein R3E86_06470 [Pseudomonadales bacterium]